MFKLDSLELLDCLEGAADQADAHTVFQGMLTANGFGEGFCMADVSIECRRALVEHHETMDRFGSHVSGSFFPDIAERMSRHRHDPVTAELRKSARPWVKNAEVDCDTTGLGYFADITLDHGLSGAALFPVHDAGGSYAIYGLYTPRQAPEVYTALCDHLAEINLAILCFHNACHARFANSDAEPPTCLAPRERECLLWVAAGLKSKQIAYRLDLSTHTVNEAIASAMRKLGANSRAEAVAKAIVAKLIAP